MGEFAADTFDDRSEEDERHFATYKWPIHSLTTNELQIRPMTLGDYLARHFRQMASDELDEPEIRHLASDDFRQLTIDELTDAESTHQKGFACI